VAFAEGSDAVVGGSDHGKVYIFERKSGMLLELLRHSEDGAVQTVAVSGLP
jgi:hypothetical protein